MFNQINGVDGILIKINSLESMIATKVGSDNILKIRVRDGILEYTSDDNNWFPTQSKVSIEWGDIDGDIQNQADLINLINTISGGYDDFANQLSDLTTRLSTIEAKQVQQDIFNDEVSKKLETPTSHLTSAEYEDLVNSETVNINTLYIVDDTSPTYEE